MFVVFEKLLSKEIERITNSTDFLVTIEQPPIAQACRFNAFDLVLAHKPSGFRVSHVMQKEDTSGAYLDALLYLLSEITREDLTTLKFRAELKKVLE